MYQWLLVQRCENDSDWNLLGLPLLISSATSLFYFPWLLVLCINLKKVALKFPAKRVGYPIPREIRNLLTPQTSGFTLGFCDQ